MPKLKNEPIRIVTDDPVTGDTIGWQVRFYYQNEDGKTKYHSKLFSDGIYGGKEKARQAALKYRDENIEEFIKEYRDSEIEPYRRRDKRNNSGVPGIMFQEYDGANGTRYHVRAHVPGEEGKIRTKTLSLSKHSNRGAVRKACQFRYEGLEKLHGKENPYPSWVRLYNEIVETVGQEYDLTRINTEGWQVHQVDEGQDPPGANGHGVECPPHPEEVITLFEAIPFAYGSSPQTSS